MESSTGTWSEQGGYGQQQGSGSLASTGREQARGVLGAAREKLLSQLDSRKDQLADRIESVCGMLEKAGGAVEGEAGAQKLPIDKAERMIRQVSDRLRNQSSLELLDSAEDAIRARPLIAFAGLAAIGFLAVRWVRG